MTNTFKTIIPQALQKDFLAAWRECHVLFFGAPCGYGKTEMAKALTKQERVYQMDATLMHQVEAFDGDAIDWDAIDVLLVDNLHNLTDPACQQALYNLACEKTDKHFLFLGRGKMPSWLMPLQLAGMCRAFGAKHLRLSLEEATRSLEPFRAEITTEGLHTFYQMAQGYPLMFALLYYHLQDGNHMDEHTHVLIRWRLYHYYDSQLHAHWSADVRQFVLCMAVVEQFDMPLAQAIAGVQNVPALLQELLHTSEIVVVHGHGTYAINALIRGYMAWKMETSFTAEQRHMLYCRMAQYYVGIGEIVRALDCYTYIDAQPQIVEILVQNAEQNPAVGKYAELERFYLALSYEVVANTPSLMCGMSMLMAMRTNYKMSEYWHQSLRDYAKTLKKGTAEYQNVQMKLLYLQVALPQSGTDNIAEICNKVHQLICTKGAVMQNISVTSMLPSVINGGKDLSEWVRHDDLMYATLKKPMETMLGTDGIGIVDCALCESKLFKGGECMRYLERAMANLPDIQQRGTMDVEFALMGILSRVQVGQGRSAVAKKTLEDFRARAVMYNQTRFLPNIEAMLCHLALLQGETSVAEAWFIDQAPQTDSDLWTLWRYQYFVKIEVRILRGEYLEALLLLAQLLIYTKKCKRIVDEITVHQLTAICYYRMQDKRWQKELAIALDLAQMYHYVFVIAEQGVAILPLLQACTWVRDEDFLAAVRKAARVQASFYQRYLETATAIGPKLSKSEQAVLNLLCQNCSNQEIGEILGIKLPTVKTHVSSVLHKLGVKRRSEAKTVAIRRKLIDGYIA